MRTMTFATIPYRSFIPYLIGIGLLLLLGVGTAHAQAPLSLSLSFTPPTCSGDSDGTATASVSGGSSPYQYAWSNGGQTATVQGLAAGTYTVTVTDSDGASLIGSIQVLDPAPITFKVTVTFPSCNGSNGAMTAFPMGGTAPYVIKWSNGVMGASANNLEPGVPYTVEATDVNGCQADTTIQLPEIDSLNVSLLIKKAECDGIEDGTATALVVPPGGSYSYQWNVSPQNTPQIQNLAPGTFVSVVVTDVNTGCMGSASGVIGTHTQLKLKITGSGTVLCAGDTTGFATAVASNGTAPYTYVWEGPGLVNVTGPTITGLGAGAYGVTATDSRGCTVAGGIDIDVVSQLNAAFTITEKCIDNAFWIKVKDQSTDPSSTIVAWDWLITWDGGSFSGTMQNPPNIPIPNLSAGIAQLIVTSAAGCMDTLMLPFKVDSLLNYSVSTDGYDCDGGPVSITVQGDPAFSYKWSPLSSITFNPDSQHVLADPDTTSTYLLIVSNNLCFDVDSITIIRQPVLELTADDIVTCDSAVSLTATTNVPAVLVWTTLTGDTINPVSVPGGMYIVTAIDTFDCTRTDTVNVVIQAVSITASIPPVACPDTPFSLSVQNQNPGDTLSLIWSADPPDLVIDDPVAANTSASGPAGQYIVTVSATNQFGCVQAVADTVTIQDSLDISGFISYDQLCNSTSVTFFNSSGLPGVWDFGDGIGTSPLDTVTYTYAGTGTYPVTFTPGVACAAVFEDMVEVSPNEFTVNAEDVTVCDTVAVLNATTSLPGTVVWTDLSGNPVDPAAAPAGMYIATATDQSGQCVAVDTATVTVQDSIDISNDVSVVEACNSTLITFANTSGYDGVWNFGDGMGTSTNNNGTYTYTNFGTYIVTFTANEDCVLPVEKTATTAPDNFTVNAEDVTVCDTVAALNATTSLPGTVVWTDLAGNPVDPAAAPAGMYIATATDLSGQCVAVDTATVTVQDSIDISNAVSVLEACNSTLITFANTSGYTGVWDFGDGTGTSTDANGTYTYTNFGTYTVTFTANEDCVLPVEKTAKTAPDNFTVNAEDITVCDTVAVLNATTSLPGTVVWTDLSGNPVDPAAAPAGTYLATATDVSGQCVAVDTATVTVQDSIDISNAVSVAEACNSTLITFTNTSGYAGVWDFGDGTGTSTDTSGTYTYTNFGTYTVTFTADEACVLPVEKTAATSPDQFTVSAENLTVCDTVAVLSATTNLPGTVVWTDLSGNPVDPAAAPAGTYLATATDLSGQCVAVDTATVTVQDSIDISNAVSVAEACNSTLITFTNTSGYDGVWDFGDGTGTSTDNNGTYTYTNFGTYTVTFTANADCVLPVEKTAKTAPDNFIVNAEDVTVCDTTAVLNATTSLPGTVVWTDLSGNPVDPAAAPAGTYLATATDLSGQCVAVDTATVTVLDSIDINNAVSVAEACNSALITFTNTSGYDGVWDFGDGTGTSTNNNGTYTYTTFGTYTVTFTANADCVLPVETTAETAPDQFTVSAEDVTVCDTTAVLSATTNLPGTVVWTDLSGNPVDPNAAPAGTYLATATDLSGQCFAVDTATVTVRDSIDISNAVSVAEACNSLLITFTNTSGYDGVWDFGDGTGSSTDNNGTYTYTNFGTYTVTFNANADCVLPVETTAETAPDQFTVSAEDATVCDTVAVLSATTNLPGTVVWTDLAGNPIDPNAAPAGTYLATATDLSGQCVAVDTATVTVQDSIDISNAVSVAEACNSTLITFTNTSGYDGVWDFGDGTGTSTNNNGTYTYTNFGTYTVKFTANADCVLPVEVTAETAPDQFTVNAEDVTVCDTVAVLTATTSLASTIVWTDLTGNPVDPNAVPAGIYLATATDTSGQCVATDMATVVIQDSIDISTMISIDQSCNSTAVTFQNTSGYNGIWDFGDGLGNSSLDSVVYTYDVAGTYPVTFITDADCVKPFNAPLEVTDDVFAVFADDVMSCDSFVALSATTSLPGSVVWTDIFGNPVDDPLAVPAGIYIVNAVDATEQCQDADTVTVSVTLVSVTAEVTGKDTLCLNDSTTLLAIPSGNAGFYTYSWSPANTLVGADTAEPIATPTGVQTYTVTVTGDDLCTATASVTVYLRETECKDPYIFVPKAFTPNGDGNNDYFRVRGVDITEIYFIVYDRWGEEVYKTEDPEHLGWDGTYRGEPSTPDTYGWYLLVTCGNGDIYKAKGNVTLLK
ncbi:MAG: T9SS type B sorting domain-containing protein [Bacteroidetes bacterium]|nr:MAG: T9SS type B sorting domain-containing protein [Bacteroidota bacterium]